MFTVFIDKQTNNQKRQLQVPPQPQPMSVLLPTFHQDEDHQEKSRRGQEKPRVGPGLDGAVPLCTILLGPQTGKASFLPEKE